MHESEAANLRARWNQSSGEELANSLSHAAGLLAALVATPILLVTILERGSTALLIGGGIFATTVLLLYLGSTLYHAWPPTRGKRVLQVFDHAAIFLLIAGTYTPFTLGPLRGPWGWTIFGIIWALAIGGIILKTGREVHRHPKLSLALYLGMGWLIVVAAGPLARHVPPAGLAWLAAGGLAYTGGVVFFIRERLRYSHFVWHLFVLAGTSCHFVAVLWYA